MFHATVARPGPLGYEAGTTVLALAPWGRLAHVRGEIPAEAAAPERWSSGGARLRFDLSGRARSILVDGAPYRAPAPPPVPSKALGQATGPLAAYAEAPFAVVVGTGEHAAARADNQELANAFVGAWAAHAHGLPPRWTDADFRERDHPGRHLVLIGTPLSNRVLAELAERLKDRGLPLPLSWTLREVALRQGEGGRAWHRAERRPVALCWPHPAFDGRLLVILDGGPAWTLARGWREGDLPLHGLPDLVVGGDSVPPVWSLFDHAWR
jgi:hypothetical protein